MKPIQNLYIYSSRFAKHALLKLLFLVIVFFLVLPTKAMAIVDPLEVPNNKYGIHVVNEGDLENAASLVNSSNGDWGYVTLVITEDERRTEKWQEIFDKMYRLHLIPILRLATKNQGEYWTKPTLSQAFSWAEFLSQLPWVIKNRYIILFNEPNHIKEWGNSINPAEYAEIVSSYSATLKKYSPDFFILPAGFDASAPESSTTMDEVSFLKQMVATKPNIFSSLDGWTSHSYPNPGFVGKVEAKGRGTLTSYLWELDLLKSLGNTKILPVFITETGWPHQEGNPPNHNFYTVDKIAELISIASETVWNNDNIVAITPFILNYQSYPFSHFSWQKFNGDEFHPQYDAYQSIPKVAGTPVLNFERIALSESHILSIETNKEDLASLKIPIKKKKSLVTLILDPLLVLSSTLAKFIYKVI